MGGSQGFRDDSTMALVMKSVIMAGGARGVRFVQNCVTSYMDDPLIKNHKLPLSSTSRFSSKFFLKPEMFFKAFWQARRGVVSFTSSLL